MDAEELFDEWAKRWLRSNLKIPGHQIVECRASIEQWYLEGCPTCGPEYGMNVDIAYKRTGDEHTRFEQVPLAEYEGDAGLTFTGLINELVRLNTELTLKAAK